MRIAYVAAGAAGMYCGSCLHDNALVTALQRQGHDAVLVPTYTPLRTDLPDVSHGRIFYGALNVYLEQMGAVFRHLPGLLAWLLDRPGLIRRAARLGAATDPTELGALTYSILQGEEGFQARELKKLVTWLRDDFRPDVVHLTNSMFAGFARELKRELGVPVVCSLQGEDLFLDQIREPWRTRVREMLRERARDVDVFQVNSAWYAGFMAEYLGGIDRGRLLVVPLGLDLTGHGVKPPPRAPEEPFTIGYLARICPEKGLHLLAEAFHLLATSGREGAPSPASRGRDGEGARVRLRVAGYLGARDEAYLRDLEARIAERGLALCYERVGEVDREEKLRFLQSLDVLAVPTVYREPKGLFVLEALANGVPVVQPRHGAFPEMLEATGGGLLVEPDSAEDLARGLATLLHDPALRRELGERGRTAVQTRFTADVEAAATVAGYERLLRLPGKKGAAPAH
ncbi:MAG TPA: hexosyltransferase [Acidobacteria bacterium]|nr:hexosyltransferase [Acidobacteriota bacterium]